ncbi:hypothetical protein RUM43_000960 [Polyplax serrata]|uniref:DUF4772 domain-containing protein n=1 Tax=Polyplax serrata TaxID=468196 RepID=A0AAN8SGX2_POLSC
MSTGKRLAKRSIIGTRVCAKWKDGIFYSGVIQEVHTPCENPWDVNVLQQTPETTYKVLFDGIPIATALASIEHNIYNGFENTKIRAVEDFTEYQLIGAGFQSLPGYHSLTGATLQPGQKLYLTYNGREVSGIVLSHRAEEDEVTVRIHPPGHEFQGVRRQVSSWKALSSR